MMKPVPPRRTNGFVLGLLLIHGLLFAELPAFGDSSSFSACPKNGNTKIPDIAPVKAYVISQSHPRADSQYKESEAEKFYAIHVVRKIIESSASDNPPELVLVMKPEDYQQVVSALKTDSTLSPERREKWLRALKHVPVESGWAWQQDYFESFIDPKDGKPTVRAVQDYFSDRTDAAEVAQQWSAIQKKAQALGLKPGKPMSVAGLGLAEQARTGAIDRARREGLAFDRLSEAEKKERFETEFQIMQRHDVNSLSGGNIEGLPGGLCMRGDNQPSQYAEQYCGSRENQVVVNTSWLSIGHADEIVQVLRKPNAKAPCDFAVGYASPKKAMELLESSPANLQPFLSSSSGLNFPSPLNRLELNYLASVRPLYAVCEKVACHPLSPGAPDEQPGNNGSLNPLSWILPPSACAAIKVVPRSNMPGPPDLFCGRESLCKEGIPQITNREVAHALRKDQDFRILNELIDKEMAKNREVIRAKLKERLPQCEVEFVPLPNLFYPEGNVQPELKDPKCKSEDPRAECYRLPIKSMLAINPNPANSIPVENTVLTPDPRNTAFSQYISETYRKLGLKASFVDTYEYAHVNHGNLHCTTHVINYCDPGK